MYLPNHFEAIDKSVLNDKDRYKEDFGDMYSLLLGLLSTSGIYPKHSLDYNKITLEFDVDNRMLQIMISDLYGMYTYANYNSVSNVVTLNLASWTTYGKIYQLANAIYESYFRLKKNSKTT